MLIQRSSTQDVRADESLGLLLIGMGVVSLLLFAYAVHACLPFNPILLPYESTIRSIFWIPEGWKFFTRDPREDVLHPFTLNGHHQWEAADAGPYSRPAYLFGLNREARAQGLELGIILKGTKNSDWRPCEQAPASCLRESDAVTEVSNPSVRPTLCGVIGLVKQKPLPWAWWSPTRTVIMPSSVAQVRVKC